MIGRRAVQVMELYTRNVMSFNGDGGGGVKVGMVEVGKLTRTFHV